MNWFSVGLTIDTLGKILLGLTVLRVHWHVLKKTQDRYGRVAHDEMGIDFRLVEYFVDCGGVCVAAIRA